MNGLLIVALTTGLYTPLTAFTPATETLKPATSDALDPRYVPPPEPDRTGPSWVIASGGLLVASGLIGMLATEGCVTREERGRCVDPYGGHSLYPSLVVLGFGTIISGAYWSRQLDRAPEPPTP